uniref:Guanyl nucleotide exchange factor Sql2 n=1 Tax=Ganoderma boninense TaxID=34458 RepID=A0A5K1K5S8_9APHY|nr:Guanyl nucleotide exchange factor Sql2 [Ganoderma boninense]
MLPHTLSRVVESRSLTNTSAPPAQIVISTPNPDWAREVTEAEGTLAAYLSRAVSVSVSAASAPITAAAGEDKNKKEPKPKPALTATPAPGVFDTRADLARLTRVSIHNGLFPSVSEHGARETVLVFPDFKAVTEVEVSEEGAREVFERVLSPSVPLQAVPCARGATGTKTWFLRYSCVILICSHRKRDYRCWAVAPQLERAFTQSLEREGFDVHHQLEDPSLSGPALEDDPVFISTSLVPDEHDEERRAEVRRRLQQATEERRALVLFCSHVGQHKFAGNVIVRLSFASVVRCRADEAHSTTFDLQINMPTGAAVWYGRVTPHEVDAIVRETVVGGKVLPALLRGGLNLCHPGRGGLNDW